MQTIILLLAYLLRRYGVSVKQQRLTRNKAGTIFVLLGTLDIVRVGIWLSVSLRPWEIFVVRYNMKNLTRKSCLVYSCRPRITWNRFRTNL
ncbi:uncharacterized protein EDB93DRAFT_476664 [Suillus bovinus]|uniref:uncharacterized protein n=1 Tax=Suillus bovinus TaxID=48563 RepID=UPI001B861BEC|nr:uncharacterized protein EDB93DRAFT_476664 [Suillus bovinus]KAG2146465.1 hypothetical protein EDB93DRAFT_476664 [Suillus bovinus]